MDDQFSTLCKILVGFNLVTRKFLDIEFVQPTSEIFLGLLQVLSVRGGAAKQGGNK